ncbi:class I SAM-dependent methyltransferase [Shimia sp.]|uniref:class I SAM-dependent methyltransferase n=1 Tax=Shimia sp. TaxID=1954381 RepID=UPI003299E6F5
MWEDRFANSSDFLFGKDPARFLAENTSYLTQGARALSVADGEGRNSVFMAQHGLSVTALEFAPTAVARAQSLAAEKDVTVDFQQADVLTRTWENETFDLVAGLFIQFTGPHGRRKIFDGMKQATCPGGIVMLHGYTPKQLEYGTGGPPFAENMYTEVILRAAFVGWDILLCREYDREVQAGSAHSGMSALIDFIARKPA